MDPHQAAFGKLNFGCITSPDTPCPRFSQIAPDDAEVRRTVNEATAAGRVVEPQAVRVYAGRERCVGAAMMAHQLLGDRSPYQDAPAESVPGRQGLTQTAHEPCPVDVMQQLGFSNIRPGGVE